MCLDFRPVVLFSNVSLNSLKHKLCLGLVLVLMHCRKLGIDYLLSVTAGMFGGARWISLGWMILFSAGLEVTGNSYAQRVNWLKVML